MKKEKTGYFVIRTGLKDKILRNRVFFSKSKKSTKIRRNRSKKSENMNLSRKNDQVGRSSDYGEGR